MYKKIKERNESNICCKLLAQSGTPQPEQVQHMSASHGKVISKGAQKHRWLHGLISNLEATKRQSAL